MPGESLEVDYLVIGAGATGLAFADALISESDATVLMVDRRHARPAGGYVVIGAGKTGMDACNWLLDNGVDPDEISWIKPRDSWVIERATFQPREKVRSFIIAWAAAVEAAASATSIRDLFGRLEEAEELKRVDASIEPTMYRMAILSEIELGRLRSIEHVIRAGRVRHVETHRILLEGGDVATSADRALRRLHCRGDPQATTSTDLRATPDHHPTNARGEPDVQRCSDRVSRSHSR